MSRLRTGVLVFAFFVLGSALYTYPLVLGLPHALLKSGGDYLGEAALVAWNAHRLLSDPLHLFDSQFVFHTQYFYPHSNTQAYFQTLFFPGLLAVPGFLLTDDAMLVTNLLLLLSLALSGVFACAVAFSLTGRVVPSLLAGVVFAFCPYRVDHLGQFTVQQGFLLPVIFWAAYRFLLAGRWRHLLVLVLGLWGQALSTLYYAYAGGLLLVAFAMAFLLLRPGHLSWRLVARGAAGLALLGVMLAPFLKPYLAVHAELGFQRDIGLAQVASMDLLAILDPGIFNRLYPGHLPSVSGVEGGLFPGFVGLGLALAALWTLRTASGERPLPRWTIAARRGLLVAAALCLVVIVAAPMLGGVDLQAGGIRLLRLHDLTLPVTLLPFLALAWVALEGRRGLAGPLAGREWVVVLVFLTVLMYLLTTGPTLTVGLHPWGHGFYRWLYLFVPGGKAFGAPGRWAMVFILPLALLVAFGARAVEAGHPGRRGAVLTALLLAGLMLEYVDVPLHWQRVPGPPPVYRWLARQPGDFATLELPVQEGGAEAWYMYWATVHWKRIVNGQLSFFGPMLQEVAEVTSPLDADALVSLARSIYPLPYLVVHRELMLGDADLLAQRLHWDALRAEPPSGLELVRSFDGDDVYAVGSTPETGVDLHRYFSTDFVRRHPVAEYRLGLGRPDPEVTRWVELSLNGRSVGRADGEGGGRVRLPPPYRAGDRNELRLVHRYAVLPAVTRAESYRIGRTATFSPVDIEAASGGKYNGSTVSIRVNGLETVEVPRRGYSVVALEPHDGRVLLSQTFDTYASEAESRRMAAAIDRLPPGTIVVAAVKHDGGGQLEAEGVRALRSIGAREDLRRTLWLSHLVIGVKGAAPGEAWEAAGLRDLVASVGRARPLAFVLEAFRLR